MTFSPDPRKNPVAAPVVKAFRDKGIEPEGYVLYTYGTIQAWAQAAEKAGTTDTAEVTQALHAHEFDTVQIGRESCRERERVRVDSGGRRIFKITSTNKL